MSLNELPLLLFYHATAASLLLLTAAGAATRGYASRFDKTAQHTSKLSGEQWLQELLTGHEDRIHNELGMHKGVFVQLVTMLGRDASVHGTRYVTAEEQVAIFLHYAHRGLSNRALQEWFQRSADTISKSIHTILDALTSREVYHNFVNLPSDNSTFPAWILGKKKKNFLPFFEGCLGALDGTHIPVHVAEIRRPAYRNRKGDVSQNVLMVCSFDMVILYVLSGWEGSASDSRVFEDARNTDFKVPKDCYYLGDAGYANSEAVLVPYRGVRYHLKVYGPDRNQPQDSKELFNYRHVQLRNVIERTFGVLKRRFKVLAIAQEYPMADQARIVSALAVVHNFIRTYDPKDTVFVEKDKKEDKGQRDVQKKDPGENIAYMDERGRAAEQRDEIAQAMWRKYKGSK